MVKPTYDEILIENKVLKKELRESNLHIENLEGEMLYFKHAYASVSNQIHGFIKINENFKHIKLRCENE